MSWDKLKLLFEEFGLPYYREDSLSKLEDAAFFTFTNENTEAAAHYDNQGNGESWFWSCSFFTKNPNQLYSVPAAFIKAAKTHGFVALDMGKDIKSDFEGYYARTLRLVYTYPYLVI